MRNRWFVCLWVAAVLFATLDAGGAMRIRQVAPVTSGAQPDQLTFTGKILDAQGEPLSGVKVALYQMTYGNTPYTHQVTLVEEKETGADGTYTFAVSKDSENYREGSIIARKEGLALGWVVWRMRDNQPQRGDMTLGEPKELAGLVVDENGKAVADAEVGIALAIVGDPEKERRYVTCRIAPHLLTVKTDEKGRFAFANMPAEATFEFLVKKPGRATICTFDSAAFQGGKCHFAAGQAGIQLTAPPEARIEGVVVEKAGGKPVAGVAVMALAESMQGILPPESILSAQDGSFRIGGLPAGSCPVQLVPAEQGMAEWITEPVQVSLQAGQAQSVKLELIKGGILEVLVKEDAGGKPVEKAQVSLRDSQRDQWVGRQTDPNGLVRIRVVPGPYEISGAYKQGYTGQRQTQQVEVADGETKRLECILAPSPRVSGVVRDEAGKPLEGVRVAVKPSSPEEKTSDADGRFEISWDPSNWGPGNTTFVLVARDLTRNLGAAVDIDEQTKNLDVKLRPGVVFTGKVLNHEGKPLAGARLQVMLRVSNWGSTLDDRRGEQTSGQDGTFELKAIPPERQYQVTAQAEGYGTHNVQVDAYNAKDGRMELGEFKLPLADQSVSGIVVDANDQPVADAEIFAYGPDQPERYNIKTDSQGKFVIPNVCAGRIQLNANVRGTGRLYGHYGYVMTEGGATDVKVVVSAGSSGRQYVPRKPQPLVGKPLPELKSAGVELPADANERMLLVCLWDLNQRPSRHCVAQLARQATQLSENGVVVVAIQAAKAEDSALTQWVESNKPPFQVGKLAGDVEKARFAWGAVSLPHLILTDKKQIVVAEGFNAGELDAKIQTAAGQNSR